MSYEQFEGAIIHSFSEDVKKGSIDPVNYDLQSSKARNKYNKYINDVIAVKAHEYEVTDFKRIGEKSVCGLTFEVIIALFGEKAIPAVQEYFTRILPGEEKNVLDGVSLTFQNKITGEIEDLIEVPDINVCSTVITLVHEFVHFYLKKYNIDFHKKRYYEEIFSIYGEKVACAIVEKYQLDPKFTQKIEESRLEAITWHYKEQLPAAKGVISMYQAIKRKKNPSLAEYMHMLSMEKDLPTIKEPNGTVILEQYYKNLADSYGIGYLYGESLFQRYQEDAASMYRQTQALISGQATIEDILKYYGISTQNYQTYENVEKRLVQVRKGK